MTDDNRNDEGPIRSASDVAGLHLAIAAATDVRRTTAPNPWVGAAIVAADGSLLATGATEPPGGRHAEIVALDAAGEASAGATMFVTLEPCAHHGRTPPCTDAIVRAGIRRVVVGVLDPDRAVQGRGIEALRAAGVEVEVGVASAAVERQLRPYLHHRSTGRPYVCCKVATSLDGGTAAVDGSSQWITSLESRVDGHRLRAESGAIVVGAGTVRADDPSLTVRHVEGPDPIRVVLGTAPPTARVQPCLEWDRSLEDLLDHLGGQGVLQVLIEGGATVTRSFLDAGLVDRLVVYMAPALFAGADAHPFVAGPSAPSMDQLRRGRFDGLERLGPDVRLEFVPDPNPPTDQHGSSGRAGPDRQPHVPDPGTRSKHDER